MMKTRHKNSIIFLLIVFLFLVAGFALAQGRQLEIDYPKVGGIKPTEEISVGEFSLYRFNFAIWAVGAIALIVVVIAGIRYITSTGKPEQLEGARRQILSAFWGTIILLGAYILLSTINPQLLVFGPGELRELPPSDEPETLQVIYSTPTEDLLKRIKRFAEVVQAMPAKINTTAREIETLTNKCDCGNTKSLCLCTGGGPLDTCEALFCYTGLDQKVGGIVPIGETFHPCPDAEEIQKKQKKIVDQRDVILYYRNRALSERDDLKDLDQDLNSDLEFLEKTQRWYLDTIDNNQQLASQTGGSDEQFYRAIIEILQERLGWLDEEIDDKTKVKGKLEELARAIKLIEEPTTKLGELPDECVKRVSDTNVCKPACIPSTDLVHGCFDRSEGCEPDQCQGGNPCPVREISQNVGRVRSIGGNIESIAQEIIGIIDTIPETREVTTQL